LRRGLEFDANPDRLDVVGRLQMDLHVLVETLVYKSGLPSLYVIAK
jgi:hypothetical protein